MKHSLLWRFSIIILTIAAAIWCVRSLPLLEGIDLAGGTSLLYELDLSKLPQGQDSADLAARVIEVLKKRVDPLGRKNMIWRVIGGKRIQIQMPQASKATQTAQEELEKSWTALEAVSLKQSSVVSAIHKAKGSQRDAAIDALAAPGTDMNKALQALAKANDDLDAADQAIDQAGIGKATPEMFDAQYTAQKAYEAASHKVYDTNIDTASLRSLLKNADEDPDNPAIQKQLAGIAAEYPRETAQIQKIIDSYRTLKGLTGGGVDDPQELKHLLTAAGVLDFRIAVTRSELAQNSPENDAAKSILEQYGGERQVDVKGVKARWFKINPAARDNFPPGSSYVTEVYKESEYLLCYDDSLHTILHPESDPSKRPWSVTAGTVQPDSRGGGGIELPFAMDATGAKYMGNLTSTFKNHPMTILLDDLAITAPNINDEINENGQITFGTASATRSLDSIKKEADQLKQIMDAGSLPAALQKQPISEVQISSSMGKDNIDRGIFSAKAAVVAVVAFMLVYYTITGIFADLALMVNLLLILATMAFLGGTFTLPGIAGLVLTLGMAVDANVLINERIREEIHKGASLWMAIKQGYDKVFWTIFDANLTCSLTAIVLIYGGSEEVKGFGVTLLIGLIIHMYTALFVTRTLMMAAVKWGILRAIDDHSVAEYLKELFTFTWLRNGHWPFMRVITVSNIDWIGKRHIFWMVSAVVTIAGIAAFIMRGEDKYDIEFRGGTQVTFKLKAIPEADIASGKSHYLTLDEVRERVTEMSATPDLKDLAGATIYAVNKPEDHSYEMQTTIKNPPNDPNYVTRVLLDPLAKKFEKELQVKPKVSIKYADPANAKNNIDDKHVADLVDKNVIRPITELTLDKVFSSDPTMPKRDVTEFDKGAAILLDDINPPQSAADLKARISEERQSEANIPYRNFDIIPLNTVDGPAEQDDTRPLTRAVMLSVDSNTPYEPSTEVRWQAAVAGTEWKIVTTALQNAHSFEGVTTFDAVVASQAKKQALIAIIISLLLIVIYVWIRFGGIWYGIGAILSLVHDAIVALAATVLSGVAYHYIFRDHPNWLLITDFKINLTMIAAYLTIIGYSVNDTIVIFDRVRELRGRSTAPLSAKLINDAINQCFGRTIWTTFTVFIVVLIMYIWGGEGVRGFSFAMLIGVFTGAYSTLAIASPILLTTARISERAGGGPTMGPPKTNPFLRKDQAQLPEAAPEAAPTVFKPPEFKPNPQ